MVLDHFNAPQTVANFIRLAQGTSPWVDYKTGAVNLKPYYNGVTFHRVVAGAYSQTGSRTGDGADGPGYNFRDEFGSEGRGGETVGCIDPANPPPTTRFFRADHCSIDTGG